MHCFSWKTTKKPGRNINDPLRCSKFWPHVGTFGLINFYNNVSSKRERKVFINLFLRSRAADFLAVFALSLKVNASMIIMKNDLHIWYVSNRLCTPNRLTVASCFRTKLLSTRAKCLLTAALEKTRDASRKRAT